ncbi:hypothetical protein Dda3937_04471 [Dickeya dadantii 3937]|uniref:Uncharacterized protein n=1 Tax=Dickeya dadantii (strain 3937) TaxID=198628 RepID=E0SMP4_DICD3|nr:hypothetical protein Dda3937_04471 [Dickeya dadantii 3937]
MVRKPSTFNYRGKRLRPLATALQSPITMPPSPIEMFRLPASDNGRRCVRPNVVKNLLEYCDVYHENIRTVSPVCARLRHIPGQIHPCRDIT